MIEFTDKEICEEREALVADLPEKYDQTLEEIRERYHHEIAYSEVMHPAYMLCEIVDGYLSENPCILLDEEAYKQAFIASTALFNLYQRLGALRYDAESKFKNPVPLNLGPSNNGLWMEVFYMLGRATAIEDKVRAGVAKSLFFFADDPDSDEVGISVKPPSLESFGYLLEFLGQRTWLQPPALNVDTDGMFSVFFNKEGATERFRVRFAATDMHEITRSHHSDNAFGVDTEQLPVDKIMLPDWLR